jgi:hypothetical protein
MKTVLKLWKNGRLALTLLSLVAGATSQGANILWVSDAPVAGFSGPGTNLTDQGFVKLLQDAGHNVNRFNPSDSATTVLTETELLAINTNDLIIIGKAFTSAALTPSTTAPSQAPQWNTNVTRPMIVMAPYLTRQNRLGWFTGNNLPDSLPSRLTAVNSTNPVIDFLLSGVYMNGSNTVDKYDELLDRNTSHMTDPVVAGGRLLLTASFIREDTAAAAVGNVVADFLAGTVVRGVDILPAYRMYFSAGTRESATTPNSVGGNAGRENLTPTGEGIFLRAVELALNNGVAPINNPVEPMSFTQNLTNVTILQGRPLTLAIQVSGASPRTLTWQRDAGDGTFTNIVEPSTPFTASSYTIPEVSDLDNGAMFRVIAENSINVVTSEVATLTVTPDSMPPVLLSAASLDGMTIGVCFDEKLEPASASEVFTYTVNDGLGPERTAVSIRPDGRTLIISLASPLGPRFKLNIESVSDLFANSSGSLSVTGQNLGLTSASIGTLNPVGTNFTCDTGSFELSGGGLDIIGAADQLQFAYKTVEGDFDVRVQVAELFGTNRLEGVAKAMLLARQTTDANSAAITTYVTPPAPADNTVVTLIRPSAGVIPTNLAVPYIGGGPPGWMRLKRAGDQFTTYRSTNGTDWIEIGTATLTWPTNLLVGVGAVSHRNSILVTARFNNLNFAKELPIVELVNPTYGPGGFSVSFQTVGGVLYVVQYKDSLSDPEWTSLPAMAGDGTLQTFTDSTASPTNNRFYRVLVQ